MKCDKCEHKMRIGEFPFCPHDLVSREARARESRFPYVNQHAAPSHKWTKGYKGVLIEDRSHETRVFKENRVELAGHYGGDVDSRDSHERGER